MLFKKNLESILAPLENIHTNLAHFMDEAATEIQVNYNRIAELQVLNELKQKEHETANKVKENIKNLLGKL